MTEEEKFYTQTPLVESEFLGNSIAPFKVFLKLENVQPSNSFKIRGMAELCKKAIKDGYKGVVTFSGGNAGISLAYVASKLKTPCHIFVSAIVSERLVKRMKLFGAVVHVAHTAVEAYAMGMDLVQNNPGLTFLHPYNDPVAWEGYSNIVKETKIQLNGVKPSCFVLSVGGGGLLMGTLMGLGSVGWADVPVVAMETVGADSLNKTLKAGKIVEVELTSIAKCLGAPSVTPQLLQVMSKFNVLSATLADIEAVKACLKFADDHGFLVEPACGVSLAVAYGGILPNLLLNTGKEITNMGPVVIIVCGGNDTNLQILTEFAVDFSIQL